jgi:hypothetical protein
MFNLISLSILLSRFLGLSPQSNNPTSKDSFDPLQHIVGLFTKNPSPEKSVELYKNFMTIRQLEHDMYQLMLLDRQKARETKPSRWRRIGLLSLLIIGLISCFYCMHNPSLPKELVAVLSALAAILGTCLKDIYAFEFGGGEIPNLKQSL